jgi:uncharacterized protein (DUF2252 family)
VLKRARDNKMARSAFSYVRGNTAKFYDWLSALKKGALPEGPAIWICGDCHLGNLGPVGNAVGETEVQVRDFDQSVIGNPAHDLVRLGLSLASAARGSDLPGIITAKLLEGMIDRYEMAFAPGFNEYDFKAPKTIRHIDEQAKTASWTTLADETLETEKPTIPLGRRFWPISAEERREILALSESEQIRELATLLSERHDHAGAKIVDAAYWRKGCSSLGRLRYAVLLQIGSKSDNRRHCLMDLKEATKAAAPHASRAKMPSDQAERVVAGARHMSPSLGDRMRSIKLMGKPIFVRELLPQDLKIEIGKLGCEDATSVAGFLACVVGKAHARQMDAATRKEWKRELQRSRSKSLEAPTWLWRSVVALLADHEAAYLEHCRKCAHDVGKA